MQTKIRFGSPIDADKIQRIYVEKSRAHKVYPNSIDYIVPVNTAVKAAANGIVVDFKDDSDKGGPTKDFEKDENFIEIRHAIFSRDGRLLADEYSYYGHLKKNGSHVKVGDKVKKGQIIGYSGATGWMANIPEPHLHFMVGRYLYENLKIRFD